MCDMIGYLNFSLANHNSYKCFDVIVFIIFIIDVLAMQFRNNGIEFENPNSIGIYDLIAKMPQHVDFDAIEKYLREKTFPCEVGDKGIIFTFPSIKMRKRQKSKIIKRGVLIS